MAGLILSGCRIAVRSGSSEPRRIVKAPWFRRTCGRGAGMGRGTADDDDDATGSCRSSGWCSRAARTSPRSTRSPKSAMIGLSKRDILVCMGEPVRRRAVAKGTEVWTYPVGARRRTRRPGRRASTLRPRAAPLPCDVELVMTNAHVSQVTIPGCPTAGRFRRAGNAVSRFSPAPFCASGFRGA